MYGAQPEHYREVQICHQFCDLQMQQCVDLDDECVQCCNTKQCIVCCVQHEDEMDAGGESYDYEYDPVQGPVKMSTLGNVTNIALPGRCGKEGARCSPLENLCCPGLDCPPSCQGCPWGRCVKDSSQ